jgi:hypothetical protein
VRDKLKLTETLISQLPDGLNETIDQAMTTWWYNIRSTGGLRLTDHGYSIMKKFLDLASYDVAINWETFNRRTVLQLDRKLQMPYYIHNKKNVPIKISLFGSREAVMANLYGDLKKFLDNY